MGLKDKLNKLTINGKGIFIDGKKLEGVTDYQVNHVKSSDTIEVHLVVKMAIGQFGSEREK